MDFHIKTDTRTGKPYMATARRGADLLLNSYTNKASAFTAEERRELCLEGLLPPATGTLEQQLVRAYENFQANPTSLGKFIYLASLHDRSETLFFRLVHEHIEEMMPIVYTPTVGEACQRFSHIYRRARGLFISYEQRDRIPQILANYHATEPSVIVVTDGERILGLGDQGLGGIGICIGKLALYTLCAGISPYTTLPIVLDVGTDNEERLADPLYLGLRHKRVRGAEYQDFVDRFVAAVCEVYPNVLLQWEDFLKGNALTQLARFRDRLCTFNDDIQGTAAVTVAGVYSSLRVTGLGLRDQRLVIAGAGASAQGIADLLVTALRETGLTLAEARARIWTVDSRGLVTSDRAGLEEFKAHYARDPQEIASWRAADRARVSLAETVANARPTILIGTSATPGLFDEKVVRLMAECNDRPVVFALSNPTSKCECTPADALAWSDGRALVATGSPFAPVNHAGVRLRIGQCNNSFIFPGVGLGVWVGRIRRVTDEMFLDAAKALAEQMSERDIKEGSLYPELGRIRDVSHGVATAVIRRAVAQGHADATVLDDLEGRVRKAMWFPDYLPVRYEAEP